MSKKGWEMKLFIKKSVYILSSIAFISVFSFGIAHAEISSETLVSLVNASRAENNLTPLAQNSELTAAAQAKANDMLENQYFAHTSPSGKTPWDFINAAGYKYIYAGENLAIGYLDNNELHNAWMNSPSHRENILSPNFREIGIAQASGNFEGADTVVVVQMFGSTEVNQPVNTSNSNTPAISGSTTSNLNIDANQSAVTPSNIFSGDEVELKAVVSGDIASVYFNIGKEKFSTFLLGIFLTTNH